MKDSLCSFCCHGLFVGFLCVLNFLPLKKKGGGGMGRAHNKWSE